MRIFCLLFLIIFSACEQQQAPQSALPTKGYDAFVFACETNNVKAEICNCQADVLARDLSDEKMFILAEAGVAAANNDDEKINYIIKNHPEVITAMKNLSIDAEICVAAANTELENLF